MCEKSPSAPYKVGVGPRRPRAPRALMPSSPPATAFAPPAPDAARRLLTELHRNGVAISGFEPPPVRDASDPETLELRLAEYRHFLEVLVLGLSVQLVETRTERQRLRLALAVEDGSSLESDLSEALIRVHSLRGSCTDLIAILETVRRVAPLLRRDGAQGRPGPAGQARGSASGGASGEGSGLEGRSGTEAGEGRRRREGEGEDSEGEATSTTRWSCRRRWRR